jgi:prophage antirepressor-like protein
MKKVTEHKYSTMFHGKKLTALDWDGQPAFIASQIGELLGYNSRKKFEKLICKTWADDFAEGHVRILRGDNRFWYLDHCGAFEDLEENCDELVLLSESAFHIACILSQKPRRTELREFVYTNVVPAFTPNDPPGRPLNGELPQGVCRWLLTPEGVELFDKYLPEFIAAHPSLFPTK